MSEEFSIQPKDQVSFATVARIGEQRGQIVKSKDQISGLVEAPLVPAAEYLYDLNIQTTEASANPGDLPLGYGRLSINFETLSADNQRIAEALAAEDAGLPDSEKRVFVGVSDSGEKYVEVRVKLSAETPVADVVSAALSTAQLFQKQPMSWAPRYTEAQLREWFLYPEGDITPPDQIASETGYFLGRDGLFYESEEHERKVHDSTPVISE